MRKQVNVLHASVCIGVMSFIYLIADESSSAELSDYAGGMSQVLEVVNEWNKLIDKITNVEARRQVRYRLARLQKNLGIIMLDKKALLDSLEESQPLDQLRKGASDLKMSMRRMKESLEDINGFNDLDVNVGNKVTSKLYAGLDEKEDFLRLTVQQLSMQKRHEAIQSLKKAIKTLEDIRSKVNDCLEKLSH